MWSNEEWVKSQEWRCEDNWKRRLSLKKGILNVKTVELKRMAVLCWKKPFDWNELQCNTAQQWRVMYNPNISSGPSHTRHWVRSAKHMSFDQPKNMLVHREGYLYWASFEHTVSSFDNSSSFSCRNAKDMNPWQLHSFADILIDEYMGQTMFL